MWKLVKTEIDYYKWLFICSLVFVVIINLGITIDGRWIEAQGDFPGLRVIWLGVGIVVLFFPTLFNRKSGRLRNKKLIPLSNIKISLARLMTFVCFWVCLLIILSCFYTYNFGSLPNQKWLANLVSTSGVMLLINSLPILYSDFYSTYFRRKDKILIGIFWSIFCLVYIGLNIIFMTYLDFLSPEWMINSRQTLTNLYFSKGVTSANVIFGLLIFFASVFTFNRRKLFLE